MENIQWFIGPAIILAIGGTFIFKRIKYGSWIGAFLGASVQRTIGEVKLDSAHMTRRTLKVQTLEGENAGETFVGLTLIAKAPLSMNMSPFKLTQQQARELASLLQEAAK